MPGTVKDFSLSYDAVNEDHTFTCGDCINGRVVLQLGKEAKIEYLFVKVKGDADVRWTERHGDDDRTYTAHERYFKIKQMLISEATENTNVIPGTHVYPFCLQIPDGNFPSSFEGHHGNIRYKLEAKMKRPWKVTKKASTKINFTTKLTLDTAQLLSPQFGEKGKKMNIFSSGSLSFKSHIEKTGYYPGENVFVQSEIANSSSRNLKPKYKLDKKLTYIAHGSTKVDRDTIFKQEGSPIPSKDHQTVTHELRIPPNLPPTILFCKIIRVEYKLKVYIDVPYGSDPEIKFPLVILSGSRQGFRASGGLSPFGPNPHASPYRPPHPGPVRPPQQLYPPSEPGKYPGATPSPVHPPPVLPYNPAVYPVPASLPLPQPEAAAQMPPPQYDQVANQPLPSAPPLYPALPTAPDFLASPSAPPQYIPGAGGYDFLSGPTGVPPYAGGSPSGGAVGAAGGPMSGGDPGYDPPTYEMVFPDATNGGRPLDSTGPDSASSKPPC